jgi:hypothetical protein
VKSQFTTLQFTTWVLTMNIVLGLTELGVAVLLVQVATSAFQNAVIGLLGLIYARTRFLGSEVTDLQGVTLMVSADGCGRCKSGGKRGR